MSPAGPECPPPTVGITTRIGVGTEGGDWGRVLYATIPRPTAMAVVISNKPAKLNRTRHRYRLSNRFCSV